MNYTAASYGGYYRQFNFSKRTYNLQSYTFYLKFLIYPVFVHVFGIYHFYIACV